MTIYQEIIAAKQANKKLLAVLIDPEKIRLDRMATFFEKVHQSMATHIFVGGSTDKYNATENIVSEIKKHTRLPVILFPGDHTQVTHTADGLLFLSLLSGRNPEYLIEQHIAAVPKLKHTPLEIIPTGYILIDGGVITSVQKTSNTQPISQQQVELIVNTALAGEYAGKKLIYLEAGSGAKIPVHHQITSAVHQEISIPLIVGGGIRTKAQLLQAYNAGADMVVIGTAFEKDTTFFNDLKRKQLYENIS
jgi:putative glycerol-1-phosphate prenyltransferase